LVRLHLPLSNLTQKLTGALGTLSKLPREIRDKIYGFALYIDVCESYIHRPCHYPRIGLLQASRQFYDEAIVTLYSTNEFKIFVMEVFPPNDSWGFMQHSYRIEFSHAGYRPVSDDNPYAVKLSADMLKYTREWQLVVGPLEGICETDMVPTKPKATNGEYLFDALAEICSFLGQCAQIHRLSVGFEVHQNTPGSTKLILDRIMTLRNVRRTELNVSSSETFDGWMLKESYSSYMSRTMALPEGVEAPEYDDNEGKTEDSPKDKDEDEETKGIFEFFEREESDDDWEESDYESNYGSTWPDDLYDDDYEDPYETQQLYNTREPDDIYQ
jgi:hypothetical protein